MNSVYNDGSFSGLSGQMAFQNWNGTSAWQGVNSWNYLTSFSSYNSCSIRLRFLASTGETKIDGTISNNVYGKSDTVQPPAIKVYAWQRAS